MISAANGALSTYDFEDENYPDNTFSTDHGGFPHVANAELLYLVVTNADPEARATFSEREIADVDGNGLYEFVDGWGKPICWMRWAPGLESSDRQPLEADMVAKLAADEYLDSGDADPFDPMNVGVLGSDGNVERVLGRYFAIRGDLKKGEPRQTLEKHAQSIDLDIVP